MANTSPLQLSLFPRVDPPADWEAAPERALDGRLPDREQTFAKAEQLAFRLSRELGCRCGWR